jgi:hypothetical protein
MKGRQYDSAAYLYGEIPVRIFRKHYEAVTIPGICEALSLFGDIRCVQAVITYPGDLQLKLRYHASGNDFQMNGVKTIVGR